ncbi:flagellar motor switch protein [Ligilactobacillus sp. WILCCON 0076]|uniref:Flagellar motor switch protein n=1 Tax=Ligilactobacillus ubinensis TaxID=2876789 RepID=A0A9X2FIJ6_9LACO|nr:flagellar motor switch protein [Ligilactobacillus ubinensis]MCP0886220.1 flagellar motor switch protein [Ligilactobacillus ubinensis]
MNEKEFQKKIRIFRNVLTNEKESLINNKTEKVLEALSEKETYIPILDNYQGPISEKTKQLLREIKELQETNLLLTRQALSYQNTLMQAIKDNLKSPNELYGPKKYKKNAYASDPGAYLLDNKA